MENNIILLCLFLFPLFGKVIDFNESIFFYSLPSILIFYTVFFKKESLKLKTKPFIFILLFIFLFTISALLSKNFGGSYYFIYIFINCLLMGLVAIKNISPKNFERGLLISTIIFSLIFLLDRLHLINLGVSPLSDNFIKQIYGHSYLADLLVLIFPFIISKIDPKTPKNKKYIYYFALLFFLTILIITNSRSGMIAIAVGTLFLHSNNQFQKTIKTLIIFISFILLAISFTPKYQNNFDKTITGERNTYWSIALKGFLNSPFMGNGPNTFPTIRKLNQRQATSTNLTHSSILSFLCENGIIFTTLFFVAILYGLRKTQKNNNVFFASSIIAITHSFLDPTWNSPGIFIISLYLIFYHSHIFIDSKKEKNTSTTIFCIALLCFIFFVSDTTSTQLFIKDKYQSSLLFNPFNLDSRLGILSTFDSKSELWQNNLDFTLKYFNKNEIVYQKLIETIPFPQNEKYYYQLFDLNPKENFSYYYKITDIYYQNKNFTKMEQLFDLINKNFSENQFLPEYAIPLSKISYQYAITTYSVDPQKSLKYFQFTKKIFPILGYYQIEYANALWHLNQKQQAIEALNNCLLYPQPKQQCLTYLEMHQKQDFDQPGTLEFRNYIQNKLELSLN